MSFLPQHVTMNIRHELKRLSAWFQGSLSLDVALPLMREQGGKSKLLQCCRPQNVASYDSPSYAITSPSFLLLAIHLRAVQTQKFFLLLSQYLKKISGLILTHLRGQKWAGIGGKFRRGKKSFALKTKHIISASEAILAFDINKNIQYFIRFDIQVL